MQMGSRWRHVRRGSTYAVRGRAKMQIGPETLVRAVPGLAPEFATVICMALEKMTLVDYVSQSDDSAWVRPESEFADGRFVEDK